LELKKRGVEMFKTVMEYMGDGNKGERGGGKAEGRQRLALTLAGGDGVGLRDEFYCQVR
jgi:hypothetical protein